MGEMSLFEIFIEKEVVDLQTATLRYGINGLMFEFENWLHRASIIDNEKAEDLRKLYKSGKLN